ncbi:Cyclic pyranopterin phosphate synthase (MoaA) [hydrothermal vent metagenome]|uniref:GTP 3',8-cyclase n=1 Tax=hydrothermal vent metagenome TaxID=652676 RepID=A0A3B0W2R8_9ZZZZ
MSSYPHSTQTSQHTSLIDPFGRRIEYVRLSLTDKCNMRCFYCMPKGFKDFEQAENWLTFDEIERVIKAFTELGVARVRLTGGEPLVRKNIAALSQRLTALPGLDDLSLSSNASLLDKQAHDLKQAGISRINVSLDSLKPERFKKITGGDLQAALNGLMAAKAAGFSPIKINMVAMKGINDDEFEDMVNFCLQHDFTLRFIETMPMGATGEDATDHYLDLQTVKQQLAKSFDFIPGVMPGGGPAKYVQVKNTDLRIGFITPISQHFCESCNRVRLSTDGTLYLCLGQNDKIELRPLLRQGISDNELKNILIKAITLKPEKHEFKNKPEQIVRLMSMTGG